MEVSPLGALSGSHLNYTGALLEHILSRPPAVNGLGRFDLPLDPVPFPCLQPPLLFFNSNKRITYERRMAGCKWATREIKYS